MIKIHSPHDPSIKKLLSYATSEDRVNREYDLYNQSQHRKLYTFKRSVITVGCMGLEFLNPDECEIKHIAVSPYERGSGIGSKLIQFVRNQHPLVKISAETDKDAVGFYRNCGFRITSLGEKYPGVERFLCEHETLESW